MSFSELRGNERIKELLIESVKSNNILHSYMFYGTDGIGKKIFATEFAKMILCESENKPCNNCKSCIEFESGNNPDFFMIVPEKGTIKIEQIREMQRNIIEKPTHCTKKIYIIDDADKMTKEAQNCLLKTLEEPSEFIVIILICSNENYMLPTVKSRCTKIFFEGLSNQELMKFIKEKNSDVNFNESMIQLCCGSISKSIDVIEKYSILESTQEIVEELFTCDELVCMQKSQFFNDNKEDIELLLEYMYVIFSKKINNANIIACANCMKYIQNAKNKLLYSNNFDMTIDEMLMKVWGEINEKNNRS